MERKDQWKDGFIFLKGNPSFVLFLLSRRGCGPSVSWLRPSLASVFLKGSFTMRVYFWYEHQTYTSTPRAQLSPSLSCSFPRPWLVSTTSDVHTFLGVGWGGVGGGGALYSVKYENKILYHISCLTFTYSSAVLDFVCVLDAESPVPDELCIFWFCWIKTE